MVEQTHQLVTLAHRRASLISMAHAAGVGGTIAALGALLLLVATWLGGRIGISVPVPALLAVSTIAVGVVIGTTIGYRRRPSRLDVAIRLDRMMGLRDRVGTAESLRDRDAGGRDPLAIQLVLADADRHTRGVSPKPAFPIHGGIWWFGTLTLSVLVIVAGALLPPPRSADELRTAAAEPIDPERARARAEAEREAREAVRESVRELREQRNLPPEVRGEALSMLESIADQFDDAGRSPERSAADRERAAASLSEIGEELSRHAQREQTRLDEMAAEFSQLLGDDTPPDLSPFADALREGRLDDAADALGDLMSRLDELAPADREALAEYFERLLEERAAADAAPEVPPPGVDPDGPEAESPSSPDPAASDPALEGPEGPEGREGQEGQEGPAADDSTTTPEGDAEQRDDDRERATGDDGTESADGDERSDSTQPGTTDEESGEVDGTEAGEGGEGAGGSESGAADPDAAADERSTDPGAAPQPDGAGEEAAERDSESGSEPGSESGSEPGSDGDRSGRSEGDAEQDADGEPGSGEAAPDATPDEASQQRQRQEQLDEGLREIAERLRESSGEPCPDGECDGSGEGAGAAQDSGRESGGEAAEGAAGEPGRAEGDRESATRQAESGGDGERDSAALERLLREMAEQRRDADGQLDQARRLREQAERLADEMTPEQRERLRRWGDMARRERGDEPRRPDGAGAGEDRAAGDDRGDRPRRSHAGPEIDLTDVGGPGQVLAEILGGEAQEGGGSSLSAPAQEQIRRAIERGVEPTEVPSRYHRLLRRYFGRLEETASDARDQSPGTTP